MDRKKQTHKLAWEWALGCALLFAIAAGILLQNQETRLHDSVVRLHVLASSDSADDQALKLDVRDAVLTYTAPLLTQTRDTRAARTLLRAHLPGIEQAARQTIAAAGRTDTVSAELTDTYFPTRYYDGFALPQGQYEALRVVIGPGQGQNWWCVVFPPLCAATVEQRAPQSALSDRQTALLWQEEPEYVFEFKCLEWWARLKKSITN